jgi:hypothetical protein
VDRLSEARERVDQVRAKLHSPARALPCIQCRYFELVCTHPAAIDLNVSPVSGKTSANYPDAAKVRAESGICGPEGALFDARSVPGQVVAHVINSTAGRWALFFVAAAVLDSLLR